MSGFNELSAGQRQKVAIVMGLAQKSHPPISDEPPSNLYHPISEGLTDILIAHGGTGCSFGTSSQNMKAVS